MSDPARTLALMDYFAPEVIQNGAPQPGERYMMAENAMFEAVEVAPPGAHMPLGTKLYGPELRAVQLVWTDGWGRWPWDAGFEYDGLRQPVPGIRKAAA